MTPDMSASEADLDADLEAEIWQMFCEDAPAQMATILAALAAGDVPGIAKQAHRLAGDSGAVGCVSVEVCGRDLERAAKTPGAAAIGLAGLVQSLDDALSAAMAEAHATTPLPVADYPTG